MSKAQRAEPAIDFVAYYRVSTQRQGRSGLGLEAQQEAVQSYLVRVGGRLVEEIVEVESGRRNDRPKLAEAMRLCRARRARLVIAKLDRLARNVHFVSGLLESGVDFVAVDFPQMDRFMVHVLSAVAEHEAAMISGRIKAALAAAKARGVKLGGDRGNLLKLAPRGAEASRKVRGDRADDRARALIGVVQDIQRKGTATLSGIAAELNGRGYQAPRGGAWSAAQVRRVIERAS